MQTLECRSHAPSQRDCPGLGIAKLKARGSTFGKWIMSGLVHLHFIAHSAYPRFSNVYYDMRISETCVQTSAKLSRIAAHLSFRSQSILCLNFFDRLRVQKSAGSEACFHRHKHYKRYRKQALERWYLKYPEVLRLIQMLRERPWLSTTLPELVQSLQFVPQFARP